VGELPRRKPIDVVAVGSPADWEVVGQYAEYISQEMLLRLRWSLGKERDERRNRALTAICDLISNMAKRELLTDLPEQQSWHRDPFTFRAFKVAVAELLEGLEHELELSGEMHPPP